MEQQLYKKDPQRPPIGVETAALRKINKARTKFHDKPCGIRVMMTANRKIRRGDIIPRRSRRGVMETRNGGRYAPVMGHGYDDTEVRQGEWMIMKTAGGIRK